jgi:hypothetical protein
MSPLRLWRSVVFSHEYGTTPTANLGALSVAEWDARPETEAGVFALCGFGIQRYSRDTVDFLLPR